jgi:hypothetical protein
MAFTSYIVFRKRAFFLLLLFILILISLFLISVWVLKLKILGILLLAAIIAFILSMNAVLKRFTRRVVVSFNSESFSIQVMKLNNNQVDWNNNYDLDAIANYGISFPNRKFVDLRFNLREGKKVTYSFSTIQTDKDQPDAMVLMDKFHALVVNYNQNNSKYGPIEFQPSFYATKTGLLTIILVSIFFIIAVIIHIIYDLKTFPFTLVIGFALIFEVIMKRRTELKYFNKMK